ncbi:MAG: dipeptidase [Anaerolineaceae bacterium]|nr:dipeptidase [Anaerolineaceae bacterium]
MFKLSPNEEERAVRLHHEAVVIDSLGGYEVLTDAVKQRIDEMIDQDKALTFIFDEIARMNTENPPEKSPQWQEHRQASGVSAISTTMGPFGEEMWSYENAVRDIAAWLYKFDVVDELIKVCSSEDIEYAKQEGKLGIILNFQNTAHIRSNLENLDFFYQLGIRVTQLTYNDLNLVGAGCTERSDCGLSSFGLKVVERMNKLGMLIDVSHTGFQTTMDTIEASDAPVAFTHTVCKAVRDHDRGKTDEQMEALAKKDGYMGIVVVPGFVTDQPHATLEHFLEHVDHAVKVMGADKVGIGTDLADAYEPLATKMNRDLLAQLGFREEHMADFNMKIEGYRGFQDFSNLTRGLVTRGYSDDDVKGILGGNFLRLFKEVVG